MSDRRVRVRFAPSPTGPLHIGGVKTALYSYLFAKKHGGDFILRIEDTDQTRLVEGAEDYVNRSLAWCGLGPDESPEKGGPHAPYKQSERNKAGGYKVYADQLLAAGLAYYAFDTPEELEAMRERLKAAGGDSYQYDSKSRMSMTNSLTLNEADVKSRLDSGANYVIRIKMPEDEMINFTDMVRGDISVNSSTLDDKVLMKSDGMPTYHLANVADDHDMKISHVIRGEEWLPSAPMHVMLYKYLGWEDTKPDFAHIPLILKPSGKGKLSKRDGDKLGFSVFPLEWKDPESGNVSTGYKE
ncbi:MAG: glutamate--tRNA ligase, partial [Flavobacteriales bacterium]|nr:glutamate--tRNA ligase [Flavobacteriales bacterium]